MANCKNCGNELPPGAEFCPRCGTPVPKEEGRVVVAQRVASTGATPVLALWLPRFVAWLIDVAIIGAFTLILGGLAALAGTPFSFSSTFGLPSWFSFFISISPEGFFRFLYWTFMEGSSGQSFGKMVMRLKVVDVDGAPVHMEWAAVESAGKAFFLPLDLIIGWFLYARRRQRVFNYLSQTIVVKAT